jgi:prepilin-type N-terminal cleavage/methylation domain-containing protein
MSCARRNQAFTLIEVLAAVFLTAVAMTVAIAFFVNLSDSTDAAAEKARQGRLALAVLDRVGRDLEGAYLLAKPAELDPLRHPWLFAAENHELDGGSDRLRFVTRNHRPRNPLEHGSDLALVTYMLRPSDDSPGYELLRAVSPGLPEELERDFPSTSDEQLMVVAENIDHFAMRFMGSDLEWTDEWDSSQLEQSSELPRAAEIEIGYLPTQPPGAEDDFEDLGRIDVEDGDTPVYALQMRLPMKPVDLDKMLQEIDQEAAAAAEAEESEDAEDFEDEEDLLDSLPEGVEIPEGFDPGQLEVGGNNQGTT